VVEGWGQRYRFQVRAVERVGSDELSVLGHEGLPWLSLLTCADFDPVAQGYRERLAVHAVLIRIDPSDE
jgi:hypothetical protein